MFNEQQCNRVSNANATSKLNATFVFMHKILHCSKHKILSFSNIKLKLVTFSLLEKLFTTC